jgi:hypothetical protein
VKFEDDEKLCKWLANKLEILVQLRENSSFIHLYHVVEKLPAYPKARFIVLE